MPSPTLRAVSTSHRSLAANATDAIGIVVSNDSSNVDPTGYESVNVVCFLRVVWASLHY